MKRLFFGLEIGGEARELAESVLTSLSADVVHQGTRWIRPDKIHLTLAFIGHVPEEMEAPIDAAGDSVAAGTSPLTLATADLGGFPHIGRPKVVWLGLSDSPELADLQNRLVEALTPLVEIEDREYHPHITLGRISPGSPKVGAKVKALAEELALGPVTWVASELILYQSTSDGRYEILGRYPFSLG